METIRELVIARARISRAQENIKEFAEVLDDYVERRPSKIQVDIDSQGLGKIRVERQEPLHDKLPILLGEALHNLRAGLDNCLYAVAIIDSGENPPPNGTQLQWPIALTPKEWAANAKRLKHLSPHLIASLHRIQPFQAESPEWNCLRILHDLARIDRHRVPHELAMWPEKVKGTYDKTIIRDLIVNTGPLRDEGIVVTFTKIGQEELTPEILDLDFEFDLDVREVELVPHLTTGRLRRPWGSLDNRLKAICLAAEDYGEGLVALAQDPELARNDHQQQ